MTEGSATPTTGAGRRGHRPSFELNRTPGFLLNDNCPHPNFSVTKDVADLDLQVTAAKFAADG